ncbi:MAG TPA: enoyl-CoA hydratase-related protein [Myxococcota bacterium]|nr:enoyl-CoA hydratase-related protein [Myxococcota bacterium]
MTTSPRINDPSPGVRLITLNRPEKKNAFDDAQWDGFADALRAASADEDVAAVVVTGAGGDFSAGVDLSSFAGGARARSGPFASGYDNTMDALVALEKPLLAAARGVCVGFGATFLFHCDCVYLGASARLRLPFVRLGLVPEGASSYLLSSLVGPRRAGELMYTAEWIPAARALELGIATSLHADDAVLDIALAKAREIAQFPVSALRETKRTLKAAQAAGIRGALAAEAAGMKAQAGSPENVEAVRAFMEKREPDYRAARARARTEKKS